MSRHTHGYSQKKVAKLLGLSDTSTLSRWEHGIALPSLANVFRLAHLYQTLPHELFSDLWLQFEQEFNLLAQDNELLISNQSFYI